MIYVAAVFLVRYVEHMLPFVWELGSLGDARQHLLDEILWAHFWSVQIWLTVLFFVYTSLHEVIRVIGREEALRMFFGKSKTAGT